MARGFQGAVLRILGAGDHRMTVVAAENVTPHYRRLRFHAPTLFDQPFEPAAWVRLWVPDQQKPERQHQRGYTLLDPDEAAQQVSIEFVLHDIEGPASAWARHALPGDELAATRYGSTKFAVPDPVPAGFLLVGDPASIPALNSIVEAIPEELPIRMILEQSHPEDRDIPLTAHPRRDTRWIERSGAPGQLASAIEDRDWSDHYAWVVAESAATRAVKDRLKELGFPRTDVHSQAYWIVGRAMGVSRDAEAEQEAPSPAPAPSPGDEATSLATSPEALAAATVATPAAATRSSWRSTAGSTLLAPLRGRLTLAGILQGLVSLLQLAPYLVIAELLRRVLSGQTDGDALLGLGILALVLFGAGTTLALLLALALHLMDARFGHEVRTALVAKLPRLPLGWFDERSSGRVRQAVQDDAAQLHYLVTHVVVDVVAAVVTPLAVIAYLFTVDARIAGLLLVPLVIFALLTARMVQASGAAIPASVSWTGRMSAESVAYLDGLEVVRSYEQGEDGAFRRSLREHARFLDEWQRPFVGVKSIIENVTRPATSLLLISALGALLVITGAMSAPTLVPFLLLGVTFSGQLLAIGYGFAGVREATAAARRIGLLLTEEELPTPAEPSTLGDGQRTVRFENVSFGYRAGHPVLQDIELELAPGTVTALVGPSGAGKSTLAALLARFHDVTAGRITLDGTDLRELGTAELYATVGFVFQTVSLIRGTVHENIALGRPHAERDEVIEAARAAQLHERILRLPQGYDTVLGDGAALSGGEGQRLQIARAILADPRVLVLDEATAFADPESEYQVQKALSELVAGRTVLVIAHRLHTITGADRIVVLEKGRIREQGTHAELLAEAGLYRELWLAGGLPAAAPESAPGSAPKAGTKAPTNEEVGA